MVVSLMAITLTLGVPALRDTVRSNQLATSANRFISALNLARSEAVKRGMRVTVRKTSAQWENGWRVFTDSSPYGTQESSDLLLREYSALPPNYTLRGNNNFLNFISYLPGGESNNSVGGSFVLCDNKDHSNIPHYNTSRLIIINGTGRVRLGIDKDGDGIPEKDNGANLASCINP